MIRSRLLTGSLTLAATVAATIVVSAPTAAVAKTTGPSVMYNSIISPLPGNFPSVGAEAYAFDEFGNQVNLVNNTKPVSQVVVTMSSWGCTSGHWYDDTCVTTPGATFSEPVTLNIYSPPAPNTDTPGSLIGSVTQTFSIPYRPSDNDSRCPATDGTGRWYDASSKTCYHGLATNIVFDLSSLNAILPNSVVYGIAYNTSHYGYSPFGEGAACYTSSGGCGYDSLNIALTQEPTDVTVGSDPNPGTVFQYSPFGSQYCDGGTAGTSVFRQDSPGNACWSPYVPAVQFKHS